MGELHELSAVEQAAAVRRREVSPVELVEHHLRRAEEHPELGAFTVLTPETALDQAATAERLVRHAEDPDTLPPLLGVPTAIKDLTLTAGVRTTFGSAAFADYVPHVDEDAVVLLRQAGTISIGKTSTPEFGMACYTEPAGLPPAVTPHDPTRLAGGSSGGAGAAVAAGLLPFAQGSDGAGSLRIPAACCGLVGLKPTRGRVPRGPFGGDVTGFSVVGPLARTVADAAAMLDALAVEKPGEPWTVHSPGESFLAATHRPPGRLRVGRYATPIIPGVPVEPEYLGAWEDASALLEQLGHDVVDVELAFAEHAVAAVETIWNVVAHSIPTDPAREQDLLPLTRWLRERGSATSAPEFLRALQVAHSVARAAVTAHLAFDVVLTPALAHLPPPVGWFSGVDPAQDLARQKAFTPFTTGYNVTGQPALALPLSWTADGLPVAVQLVGRHGEESLLLCLAAQLEQARPWAAHRPACW
ncbi:amidase [Longimycelium tulufanense]|uniref:Amidase n=1 Tax=Longimycelium tulufanense TaxID=907463 RepID=A0A8J3FVH6_9PSEU|nr:amidase [Longimycelium tulufanense]GGM63773.1 amidase [Longimycelium tulufanense]